ncbi:hypothetical protein IH601_07730 [Candidatus Bipolaricaulota bacterium]|jgi:hypothetical protein|nr:hypothetical protein [Candidatus Bipolaricaulota bacterium]TFH11322.1 MAG: hypothetical protein E4H08_01665 [Candidatus Atribacteria bacterium]
MKASVVLNSTTAKRLIAQGVAAHPIVVKAMGEGTVIVTLGTTNGYVASELLGAPIDQGAFAAGVIDDRWNINARLGEATDLVLKNGAQVPFDEQSVLSSLTAGDVVIKGGNALDPFGTVGVLLAAATGGTVGRYVPTAIARGVDIVIPISLAKSIHTPIGELTQQLGSRKIELPMGLACGMYPLTGHVVTEIEALELLFEVHATHVCSNGIGTGQGSISLLLEGGDDQVRAAFEHIKQLAQLPVIPVEGRR